MNGSSEIVAEGMKRVTEQLSIMLKPKGFVRIGSSRGWQRLNGRMVETVHLQRRGGSYGPPRTASVDLRLTIGIREMSGAGDRAEDRETLVSDQVRRPNGHTYHHRFNAATGSTYERCLQELELFLVEFAEPWFAERREKSRRK